MTQAFAVETTIDQPVSRGWERLVDWETADRWMPGIDAMRAEGPTAADTELVFTARGKERRSRIVALEPGRSITLRSTQGGVTADYRYLCVPEGRGARVGLVADCSVTGAMRPFGPLIRWAIRRADSRQLEAFAATFAGTSA